MGSSSLPPGTETAASRRGGRRDGAGVQGRRPLGLSLRTRSSRGGGRMTLCIFSRGSRQSRSRKGGPRGRRGPLLLDRLVSTGGGGKDDDGGGADDDNRAQCASCHPSCNTVAEKSMVGRRGGGILATPASKLPIGNRQNNTCGKLAAHRTTYVFRTLGGPSNANPRPVAKPKRDETAERRANR